MSDTSGSGGSRQSPWVEVDAGRGKQVRARAVLQTTLADLPLGVLAGGNRYDTDTHHVLHLWDQDGNGYDIRWRRD